MQWPLLPLVFSQTAAEGATPHSCDGDETGHIYCITNDLQVSIAFLFLKQSRMDSVTRFSDGSVMGSPKPG